MVKALQEPFHKRELLGYFRWSAELSDSLIYNPWIYHACHADRIKKAIRFGRVNCESAFDAKARGENYYETCSWWSMHDWHETLRHNFFGPFIIQIRTSELNGRRFYVFKRGPIGGYERVYFVERETSQPLFYNGADSFDPRSLFCPSYKTNRISEKSETQYEILLTTPMTIARGKVSATNHLLCHSPGNCCGGRSNREENIEKLESILGRELPRFNKISSKRPLALRHVIPAKRLVQSN